MANDTKRFNKPPLTPAQRVKRTREIIEGVDNADRTKVRALYLRMPETYFTALQELHRSTGLSMNSICLEILRPGLKQRLKEKDIMD